MKPVMTYGSEAWVVRSIQEDILRRAEPSTPRKMCGVKLADRINARELMESLGLKDTIVENVRHRSLRGLGRVLRKDDNECVKQA